MKIVLLLLLCVLTVSSTNLLQLLHYVHSTAYFDKMPADDRIILIELLAEAETGDLTKYVQEKGIPRLLEVTKHMPKSDATLLVNYLTPVAPSSAPASPQYDKLTSSLDVLKKVLRT